MLCALGIEQHLRNRRQLILSKKHRPRSAQVYAHNFFTPLLRKLSSLASLQMPLHAHLQAHARNRGKVSGQETIPHVPLTVLHFIQAIQPRLPADNLFRQ